EGGGERRETRPGALAVPAAEVARSRGPGTDFDGAVLGSDILDGHQEHRHEVLREVGLGRTASWSQPRGSLDQLELTRRLGMLAATGTRGDPEPLRRRPSTPATAGRDRSLVTARQCRTRIRLVHGTRPRADPQTPGRGQRESLPCDRDVLGHVLGAGGAAAVQDGRASGRPHAPVGIDPEIARPRPWEHEAFDELDGELARVDRLLDVVRLHVGEDPHVAGILAARVAGVLAGARTLPGALPGILLRDADRVGVEEVVGPFGEPQDDLVT